jgi:hypothetical protein
MKTKPCSLLAATCLTIGWQGSAAVMTWTNTAGGNWNLASNWSPNAVPGGTDTANVSAVGTYVITLDTNASVENLALGGAASGVQTLQANGFVLVATNALIANGGILSLTGSTLFGAMTVANGGVLTVNGQTIDAQVAVENGGQMLLSGPNSQVGQNDYPGNSNCWLWVQSGGRINGGSSGALLLWAAMTNSGTCSLTNQGFIIDNDNTGNAEGALLNQPGGVIHLIGGAGIVGTGGFDSLVNQGTVQASGGISAINVDNFTNLATLSVERGTLQLLGGNDVLGSSGTLSVALDSPTDYGTFSLNGPATLAGTLGVALNNGYVPSPGSSFAVLTYSSAILGSFTAFSYVPPVVIWQPVCGSNALTVVAHPPISLSGTNVAINVAGTPGYWGMLLTTTNLTVALTNWTPAATGTLGVMGFLSLTNAVNFGNSQQYFAAQIHPCNSGYNARSCTAMLRAGCVTVTNADGSFGGYDCNDDALHWLYFVGPNDTGCNLTGIPGGHCNSAGILLQ